MGVTVACMEVELEVRAFSNSKKTIECSLSPSIEVMILAPFFFAFCAFEIACEATTTTTTTTTKLYFSHSKK